MNIGEFGGKIIYYPLIMPTLTVKLTKNERQILRIIATNKRADSVLIRQKNLKDKSDNGKYLKDKSDTGKWIKKLVEVGCVKKIEKAQQNKYEKEGRPIRYYYEITQEGMTELYRDLDTKDFLKMLGFHYKGENEIRECEKFLLDYEMKVRKIDRKFHTSTLFLKWSLDQYYFFDGKIVENNLDLVYKIAKNPQSVKNAKVKNKKQVLEELTRKLIIKKKSDGNYQITLKGLWWVLSEIQKIKELRVEEPEHLADSESFKRDVKGALEEVAYFEDRINGLRQEDWDKEKAIRKKKGFFESLKVRRGVEEKTHEFESKDFRTESQEFLFPYFTYLMGGSEWKRTILANYMLNSIVKTNSDLLEPVFKNWDWLRTTFPTHVLLNKLIAGFRWEVAIGKEDDAGLGAIYDGFEGFLNGQIDGFDREIRAYSDVEEELVADEREKYFIEHQTKFRNYKKRQITFVEAGYHNPDSIGYPTTPERFAKLTGDTHKLKEDFLDENDDKINDEVHSMPIYHVIERLRRETHELQAEQLSPDEDYVEKIISFSFFIRLFHWAKQYSGEIHNGEIGGYEKLMDEFSKKTECSKIIEYWKRKISDYEKDAREKKDEFWNGVKPNNEKPRQQYFDLAQTNKVKQENPDLIN